LFTRAIAQSGGASWISTKQQSTAIAQGVIDRLGVRAGDTQALLAVSTDAILDAMPSFTEGTGDGLPFQPVVDGVVLPIAPLDAIRAGNADGVALMAGTNKDEITLFQFADEELATLDHDGLLARLRAWCGEQADALVANYGARRPDATPRELWRQLATDAVFLHPVVRMLDAQATHGETYGYFFTWETPLLGGAFGSTHALEIPFVFDNLDQGGADFFTGTGAERQGIADEMHRAWIAFARTGNPNHAGLPEWPRYEPAHRPTMRFDTAPEVLVDRATDDLEAIEQAVG
jgi:para-nitrobenzyl esterase